MRYAMYMYWVYWNDTTEHAFRHHSGLKAGELKDHVVIWAHDAMEAIEVGMKMYRSSESKHLLISQHP